MRTVNNLNLSIAARRPDTCRCPACNPMNLGKKVQEEFRKGIVGRGRKRLAALPPCEMCGGKREVAVEAAARWMMAFTGMTPSRVSARRKGRGVVGGVGVFAVEE